MPRLVRKQPWSERIKNALDPYDLLLWISEELHDSNWDESLKDWMVPIGFGCNMLFVVARANSRNRNKHNDDVFGDYDGRISSGWFNWLCSFVTHLLVILSVLNTIFTFLRKRHYRLFESSIDQAPSTPSAKRVNVDSSPASSSPFRYLTSIFSSATAESRAHPDQSRDVWEISVWDPKEANLDLFTLFSPGHALIYWMFLPTTSSDVRPSVTIVVSLFLAALLSAQMIALQKCFTQQAKDMRIINKEVMNEYDTKYVHPTINKQVREVGTQTRDTGRDTKTREVVVYTPTTLINRGFRINPNPNYISHLSDSSVFDVDTPTRPHLAKSSTTPALHTPNVNKSMTNSFSIAAPSPFRTKSNFASPSRQSQPLYQRSSTKGDGGSLGVFSHANSPLKKAASSSHLRPGSRLEENHYGIKASPLKRMSTSDTQTDRRHDDRYGRLVASSSSTNNLRYQ